MDEGKYLFYKLINDFLQETENNYIDYLRKNNSKYKIFHDSFYSNLKLLSKKLPNQDNILDNLVSNICELSRIQSAFLYSQGFKDCNKLYNMLKK